MGDIISFNESYWEVNSVVENTLVAGQTDNSLSISVTTHMSRRSQLQIERVRVGNSKVSNQMRNI